LLKPIFGVFLFIVRSLFYLARVVSLAWIIGNFLANLLPL